MSRLLFVGLVNFLIALFVPLPPIVATGDNDLDRLVDMVNKFGAEVMPSLQALRNNPYSPSPMRTLGKLVDHLETEFEDVQNESKGHKSATLWAHLGLINDFIYSELNILRYKWYGMNNPYGQIFTQNMVNMDPSSGHVKLNAHLMKQLEMLKKELEAHKQYDDSMANFSEKTHSGRRALHLAFDCVDTLEKMYKTYKMYNMPKRRHGRHASVSEEELHWALSTLAVNLWAYAAMGTEGGPFVLPGIEEAAKTVEQAHPIEFKMPKRSGVEKAESSDGKNVAGKTGAKHVHGTMG